MIALFIVAAIVGPFVVKYPCDLQLDIVGLKNRPPSAEHWFGTDQYSRDLFSRVLCGARISLSVGTLAVVLSVTIGTIYGLVAGYFGGRIDGLLMRVLDGFLAIPRVLLLLAILTLCEASRCRRADRPARRDGWFGVSRLVRAETLIGDEAALHRSRARARRIALGHPVAASAAERHLAGDRRGHARRRAT